MSCPPSFFIFFLRCGLIRHDLVVVHLDFANLFFIWRVSYLPTLHVDKHDSAADEDNNSIITCLER